MSADLGSVERKSSKGFPKTFTRVRVEAWGDLVEGIVVPSRWPNLDESKVLVGLWVGWFPKKGFPPRYVESYYAPEEMEIISEPGKGGDGWIWPDDPYED